MCLDFDSSGWCGHMNMKKNLCNHIWQNKGRSLVIGDAYRVVCYECGSVFVTDYKTMLEMTK